jgi:ribosomal protein S18 acetylase RimI-like enzyme
MLQIRIFQSADAEAVRQLFAQGQMDFAQGTGLEEEALRYIQHSLSDDLADIPRHYLNVPGSNFWVAELGGEIKGMVGLQYRNDDEAELRRMSVASDSRRRGIGGKLLAAVEAFCRKRGYRRIRLTTVTHLVPAIAMYQKYGYRRVGEEQFGKIVGQHFVKCLDNSPEGPEA